MFKVTNNGTNRLDIELRGKLNTLVLNNNNSVY